jgi:hypothetical protein
MANPVETRFEVNCGSLFAVYRPRSGRHCSAMMLEGEAPAAPSGGTPILVCPIGPMGPMGHWRHVPRLGRSLAEACPMARLEPPYRRELQTALYLPVRAHLST